MILVRNKNITVSQQLDLSRVYPAPCPCDPDRDKAVNVDGWISQLIWWIVVKFIHGLLLCSIWVQLSILCHPVANSGHQPGLDSHSVSNLFGYFYIDLTLLIIGHIAYSILSSWNLCRTLFLPWCRDEYLKYALLNSLRPFCLSTMRLSSHSTTLPFFLPSFLNTGFTSTSVQRVLGHSECLCSKLEGVKQSCGHAVTTPFPIGPQSICLSACTSSLIRCVIEFPLKT